MRVVAAAFAQSGGATGVLRELRRRFGLAPGDAAVAPLGNAGRAEPRTVFAGRFEDDAVAEVRRVVEEYGGEVVSEVDERWTRSSSTAGRGEGGDRGASGT